MPEQKKVTICIAEKHIAIVTIDAPPMNPLNKEVMSELQNAFEVLLLQSDIRVVILTGSGKAFVAGADIKELAKWTPDSSLILNGRGQNLVSLIENYPGVVIAAINGYALGGGLEIAMACDLRIASEKAKVGLPEVKLGIIPGYGGTCRLPRLIGLGQAKKMIFTGEHISAQAALALGLVEEVTSPDNLLERATELAKQISANAPIAVKKAKELLNYGRGLTVEESLLAELKSAKECYASKDSARGIEAFIEKREPLFLND